MNKLILLFLAAMTFACANKRIQGTGSSPINEGLYGSKWTPVEINGLAADRSLFQKAWLIMNIDEKRIYGNAGCNNFNGMLNLSGEGLITISEVIATKMACEDMSVEYALLALLKKTTGCKLIDDTLVFIDANGAYLAEFVRGDEL